MYLKLYGIFLNSGILESLGWAFLELSCLLLSFKGLMSPGVSGFVVQRLFSFGV